MSEASPCLPDCQFSCKFATLMHALKVFSVSVKEIFVQPEYRNGEDMSKKSELITVTFLFVKIDPC